MSVTAARVDGLRMMIFHRWQFYICLIQGPRGNFPLGIIEFFLSSFLPGGYENVRGGDVRILEVVELLVCCPRSVTFRSSKLKLETFLR